MVFLLGFGGICAIFWWEEMRFLLPTPKPKNFLDKKLGAKVNFKALFTPKYHTNTHKKATLLHFFSAKCPCSRFNATHIKELLEKFDKNIHFVAIIEAQHEKEAQQALNHCGLDMDFVVDTLGKIADSCGVYSTPQAVILDKNNQLYFKGNYNISRYCADESTQFVRLALQTLLQQKTIPSFPINAFQAYGCELESDKQGSKE